MKLSKEERVEALRAAIAIFALTAVLSLLGFIEHAEFI